METSSCCSTKSTSVAGVIDPICGMELDPSDTKLHVEHKGEVYYFCNTVCKNHFVNDPQKYIS